MDNKSSVLPFIFPIADSPLSLLVSSAMQKQVNTSEYKTVIQIRITLQGKVNLFSFDARFLNPDRVFSSLLLSPIPPSSMLIRGRN